MVQPSRCLLPRGRRRHARIPVRNERPRLVLLANEDMTVGGVDDLDEAAGIQVVGKPELVPIERAIEEGLRVGFAVAVDDASTVNVELAPVSVTATRLLPVKVPTGP